MTAESELAASPSTTVSSSKTEHYFTRPPTFPNKSETTSSAFATTFPSTSRSESVLPSPSQANDSLFSKPSFLVPGNPARRERYEGRFPPSGPGRVPSLDRHFSFHRSNSSRSSSPGGSSDWSSFKGFMEVGPEERQEWLRMENVMSPSEYGWGLNREGYDRCLGQTCIEKITAGSSQSPSPSPSHSPRFEICGVCSRALTQRSPWASSRVMGFHECNVVGVLVCGHTYHTECLEQITPHSSRQDPACPHCNSEKVNLKKPMASISAAPKSGTVRGSSFMSRPSPRNKLSRVGVLDDSFRKPRFLTSSPEEPSP